MDTRELTFFLTSLNGTSGDEFEVAQSVGALFSESESDILGNVIVRFNRNAKAKIMIEAHMDRVGFIVTGVEEHGFLTLTKCASPDLRTAVGSPVAVYGNDILFGVICSTPPHLKSGNEKQKLSVEDLYVDIGMSKVEAEQAVSIGDRVLLDDCPVSLLGNRIAASALDDRAGVAAIVLAAQRLEMKLKNIELDVAICTREEVGGQGAATAAFAIQPDFAICVDAGFGRDHYVKGNESIKMGGGTSIGIAPVLDGQLTKQLINIAKAKDISFQHDVMSRRTGTDADEVSKSGNGVKTALLSIPVTNMHTQTETVDLADIEATASLIEQFILAKETEYDKVS